MGRKPTADSSGPALRALMLLGRWTRISRSHLAWGGTCMCAGALGTLQVADLEEQVLDFLKDRYRDRPEMAAVLRQEPGDAGAAAKDGIQDLLRGIARRAVDVPPSAQADLLADLERVIESLEEVHGVRGSSAGPA